MKKANCQHVWFFHARKISYTTNVIQYSKIYSVRTNNVRKISTEGYEHLGAKVYLHL